MEIGLKLFGLDGSFPSFRRATTRACLQSFGKQAQYPLRCYGSEVLDLLSQDFVESSSFPVFQMLQRVLQFHDCEVIIKVVVFLATSFDLALTLSVWYLAI